MTVLAKFFSKLLINNTFKVFYLSFAFLFIGCGANNTYIDITGPAMGTSYTIRLVPKRGSNPNTDLIKSKIDSTLESINAQMSTYVINSDISLFNKLGENAAIVISSDFKKVIMRSIYWSEKSNGAFDITSLPLTNVWREGRKDREFKEKWEPLQQLLEGIENPDERDRKAQAFVNALNRLVNGQKANSLHPQKDEIITSSAPTGI